MKTKPKTGTTLNTVAYGRVTVGEVAEFDNIVELILSNGDAVWTQYTILKLEPNNDSQ